MRLQPTARFRGGKGPPLVLLHAGWTSWRIWTPILERLIEERDVLAPTMLGHLGGPSTTADRPPSAENILQHILAEMDNAGFEQPDIVGNSVGGALALELARRGRARSVVALCPEGKQSTRHALALAARGYATHKFARHFGMIGHHALRNRVARKFLLRDASAQGNRIPIDLAQHLMEAIGACEVLQTIIANRSTAQIGDVSDVRCPVYFIWGENDRYVLKEEMDRYRADLPTANFLSLRDCGHCPQLDWPELVAREILSFTDCPEFAQTGAPADVLASGPSALRQGRG